MKKFTFFSLDKNNEEAWVAESILIDNYTKLQTHEKNIFTKEIRNIKIVELDNDWIVVRDIYIDANGERVHIYYERNIKTGKIRNYTSKNEKKNFLDLEKSKQLSIPKSKR